MAWDWRWTTPKKFKVWWFRIVDEKAYATSNSYYDKYVSKSSHPGAAWCEGEITIDRPPEKGASNSIILHFYPDGRVESEMDAYDNLDHQRSIPRVDIAKRNEQPKLTGRACLKEIANPFYGRKEPVSIR